MSIEDFSIDLDDLGDEGYLHFVTSHYNNRTSNRIHVYGSGSSAFVAVSGRDGNGDEIELNLTKKELGELEDFIRMGRMAIEMTQEE